MKYPLVYTKRAVRDLRKLDKPILKRIRNALEDFSQDPLQCAYPLADPKLGSYRFRIGDYRVIFDLIDDQIVILRVGHRREIYRKF
jgi:mRNA interferase RelE/StbE